MFENNRVEAKNVEDFLDRFYRPDRYHERGDDYAAALLMSHKEHFEQYGYDIISRHDSVTGRTVAYFDSSRFVKKQATMKTNISTARQLLQQHLSNLRTAQEFKQWLDLRLVRDMGGQDPRAEFYESVPFEQTYQVFQDTTFHVVEGRCSWETNLLDYFRRQATDAQWLEDLYHLL